MKPIISNSDATPYEPTFADIIDFLPDPTFAIDLHGKVIAWNKAMTKLTGIGAEGMLGKNNYEYALPFYGLRRPILIDLCLEWDEEIAKKYRYVTREEGYLVSETENPPFRQEPSRYWNKACKMYSDRGICIGAIETIRDITEIKKAEKISSFYQLLSTQSRDIILFADPRDGRILDANEIAVETYGYDREQLMSMSLRDLRTRREINLLDRQMARAFKEGLLFESRHRKKDGSIFDVEVSSRGAIVDGSPILISIIRDIASRKSAERRLRRRELELERLNKQLEFKVLERTAELERRNMEIRELAQKTIQAMENDRKALSKELHDSIGGTLAAIKYQLEGRVETMGPAPKGVYMPFESIIDYLAKAIKESKRITKQLRPLILDDFGLAAAVEEHLVDFKKFNPGIKVSQRLSITEDCISSDAKTVLYRVLQEAMNNVGKHSRASLVDIEIRRYKGWVRLKVNDNGDGFKANRIFEYEDSLTGFGLHSMRERVDICKGRFRIDSAPGQGTTVIAAIPVCSSRRAWG
jgi:PAS domain S-box-containing protein